MVCWRWKEGLGRIGFEKDLCGRLTGEAAQFITPETGHPLVLRIISTLEIECAWACTIAYHVFSLWLIAASKRNLKTAMPGQWEGGSQLFGSMAPSRRDCRCDMIFLSGCLLLSVWGFQPALAKVCNDYTRHGLDNNWYMRDGEKLPIMVLMPMNESALMSSISQGIEPAVQLAIQHIRESRQYSFSLITKIYDTEVNASVNVYVHVAGVNCGQCAFGARSCGKRDFSAVCAVSSDCFLPDVWRRQNLSSLC